MTLSPTQAKNVRYNQSEDELKRHIKAIDKMLVEGDRTYACSLISNGFIEDHIIQEYRSAGWNVQRVNDFRDGSFLEFKEP